jgi:aromatic-L-amino-acid/L-tryptophan decarboxylase
MTERADIEQWQDGLGDMSPEEFRLHGHQVVEWIANYFERIEEYPVLSRVRPGEIRDALPRAIPDFPEPMDDILLDFERIIVPGVTHWNHPSFFSYFAITGSAPGVLGELLAAALNVNAMLWRTSPAATELEETTLGWLRDLLGMPSDFEGVIYDTASISSLVAIASAREAAGLDIRELGMAGRTEIPSLRLYCSDQAHSSIEKSAITLGLGVAGVRKISTDPEFRMNVDELISEIERDIAEGRKPFCVVATVGTTATTSIDPVPAIAEVCIQYGLWLHVDAAYGGAAAAVPEMQWIFDGVEHADSIVVNPHKWLFTPVDLSTLFTRRLGDVSNAFSLIPPYLRSPEGMEVRNFMDYGPQLGRRFRALKLWFVLRSLGREGIIARLREHMRLAREFSSWLSSDPSWDIVAPTVFSTVVFRAAPVGMSAEQQDELNRDIEARVNRDGEMFIASTVLRDRVVLRLALGNLRTEERHVERAWYLLRDALATSLQDLTPS